MEFRHCKDTLILLLFPIAVSSAFSASMSIYIQLDFHVEITLISHTTFLCVILNLNFPQMNLSIICQMLYVRMYACMSMKDSVSFDSNNAIFTQNTHEGTGRVNSYIRPKSVQNWLKYQCKCAWLQ